MPATKRREKIWLYVCSNFRRNGKGFQKPAKRRLLDAKHTNARRKEKFARHGFHGGSFIAGGSSDPLYNGKNFAAANDVVVVNFNYRLNVFGFVNFASIDSSFEDSGYLGIKDQIAALKWVKENIAAFGGDQSFRESNSAVCNFSYAQ